MDVTHLNSTTLPVLRARLDRLSQQRWKFGQSPPSQAAILVPLVSVGGKLSILFTVRSAKLRKHSGQVAFPGGRRDPTDASLEDAALRETFEEVGLPPERIHIIGALPSLPDRTNTMEVHPFLSYVRASGSTGPADGSDLLELDIEKDLKLNDDEVSSAFCMTVAELLDPTKKTMMQFRSLDGFEIPSWKGPNKEVIWGLSAYVLDRLLNSVISAPKTGARM
ncbi:nudix (nucleoside diphosphate linked moiety X)-type motif 8 [Irineochytrium annulatum]|nr:nudix (nucleoside diphosphate linked moiety X)-type motif 8 [Irineochytrium annulatum]